MTTEEAKLNYDKAEQNYANVTRGGKDYYACSFMDIQVRSDRLEVAKQDLIQALGEEALKKLKETE